MIRTSAVAALLWMLMALAPGVSQAQVGCWVGMGSINFGNVNQIGAPATTVNGTMSLSCAGARQPYVRVCIGLGAPGDLSWDPRHLNGQDRARLDYNIYKDPGYTQIWGSENSLASSSRAVDLAMNYGAAYTTVPYFARVPVQDDAHAGTFSVTYSYASDTTVRAVEYSGSPPNCSSVMPVLSRFEFGVWANVVADCAVSASALDFGVADTLARRPTRATSTISLRCTSGVPYTIALDAGTTTGATVAQRSMTRDGGAETLAYGLYTDTARRRIWGDGSSGSQTESGTGSGTNRTESHTVYGELELERDDEPTSGQYRDTITVTVTF
jgi:spore coat protein U-like protein